MQAGPGLRGAGEATALLALQPARALSAVSPQPKHTRPERERDKLLLSGERLRPTRSTPCLRPLGRLFQGGGEGAPHRHFQPRSVGRSRSPPSLEREACAQRPRCFALLVLAAGFSPSDRRRLCPLLLLRERGASERPSPTPPASRHLGRWATRQARLGSSPLQQGGVEESSGGQRGTP